MSNSSSTNLALSNNNNNTSLNNNNNNLNNNSINFKTITDTNDVINSSNSSSEQPDPDYIKMFVGQVPKSMDEDQLREMFEEFGRVHSINVLRDKVTGVSKGKFLNNNYLYINFFFNLIIN